MAMLTAASVKKLKECLANIEQSLSIKVVYASVIGSRTFGNASADSDFDLRFVYVQLPWARRLAEVNTTLQNTDSTMRTTETITISGLLYEVDIFGTEVLRHINKLTSSATLDLELIYSPLVVLDVGYGETPNYRRRLHQQARSSRLVAYAGYWKCGRTQTTCARQPDQEQA